MDPVSGTALVEVKDGVHVLYLCEIRGATIEGRPTTDGTVVVTVDMRDSDVFFASHIGLPGLATARLFLHDLGEVLR